MVTYLVRRLIQAVVLLLVITAVTFAIFFLVPRLGGATADDLASRYVGKSAGAEQIHETAVKLGFTDPLWQQYGRFVKGLVAGQTYQFGPEPEYCPAPCVGYSFITQRPVLPELLGRLPVTLSLALGAAVLWLIGGVATGVISAVRRGSVLDRTMMTVALAGVSLPIFFTGLLCLTIFSYGLHWTAPGGSDPMQATSPLDWAYRLLLPWITLAFLYAAMYARLTRAGMLETMNEDFIRTARAKGLTRARVILRHALPNAILPIVAMIGIDIGIFMGGIVVVESVFGWPGIGQLAWQAIQRVDIPIIMGVTIVSAVGIILGNLLADIVAPLIDPRIKLR